MDVSGNDIPAGDTIASIQLGSYTYVFLTTAPTSAALSGTQSILTFTWPTNSPSTSEVLNAKTIISIYALNAPAQSGASGGILVKSFALTDPAVTYNPDTGAIAIAATAYDLLPGIAPNPYPVNYAGVNFYASLDDTHDSVVQSGIASDPSTGLPASVVPPNPTPTVAVSTWFAYVDRAKSQLGSLPGGFSTGLPGTQPVVDIGGNETFGISSNQPGITIQRAEIGWVGTGKSAFYLNNIFGLSAGMEVSGYAIPPGDTILTPQPVGTSGLGIITLNEPALPIANATASGNNMTFSSPGDINLKATGWLASNEFSLANTTGLSLGMIVSGYGVPAGDTITKISGGDIFLSESVPLTPVAPSQLTLSEAGTNSLKVTAEQVHKLDHLRGSGGQISRRVGDRKNLIPARLVKANLPPPPSITCADVGDVEAQAILGGLLFDHPGTGRSRHPGHGLAHRLGTRDGQLQIGQWRDRAFGACSLGGRQQHRYLPYDENVSGTGGNEF